MTQLTSKMQLRLDKWRSDPKIPSAKVIPSSRNFVGRKDYGDEFEEEMLMQEQKNRERNGKSTSR